MRTFSTRYCAQKSPLANPSGSGGSTISFGAGSFFISTYGEGPRISFALWANAVMANTVTAAAPASVLIIVIWNSCLNWERCVAGPSYTRARQEIKRQRRSLAGLRAGHDSEKDLQNVDRSSPALSIGKRYLQSRLEQPITTASAT